MWVESIWLQSGLGVTIWVRGDRTGDKSGICFLLTPHLCSNIYAFCLMLLSQVRIRVSVQTQRNPAQFQYGQWSAYVPVQGITTPPVTPGATQPLNTGPENGLLLIFTLVPVGILLLVATASALVGVIGCWYRKR